MSKACRRFIVFFCTVISLWAIECTQIKKDNGKEKTETDYQHQNAPNIVKQNEELGAPPSGRARSHINHILGDVTANHDIRKRKQRDHAINRLTDIYHSAIVPLENHYNYRSLYTKHVLTDAEIKAKPMILFVGPWSTGKSTIINYLIGVNDTAHMLHTGAEPTTSDFTVISYGRHYRTVEGIAMATEMDGGFSTLEKFGQGFLERLEGVQMNYPLLEDIILVDTPGIIENRKQQERGYPFNDVMRWFIERAALILVVFDPTKLDVGTELEALFSQLKGRESQIRILLNKADSMEPQALMRVYGALFWSLAPLINVTEPPRVYAGSFWGKKFKPNTNTELFLQEEKVLLGDLREVIANQMENKVAMMRQHACRVRLHALLVDRYLTAFSKHSSLVFDNDQVLAELLEHPEKHRVFQSVLAEKHVNRYDLPHPSVYQDFFHINAINHFKPLTYHCSYLRGCPMDTLLMAIAKDLPQLLHSAREMEQCHGDECDNNDL